jgi:hypothetical protein
MSSFNLFAKNGYRYNVMSTWVRFSTVTELWLEANSVWAKT